MRDLEDEQKLIRHFGNIIVNMIIGRTQDPPVQAELVVMAFAQQFYDVDDNEIAEFVEDAMVELELMSKEDKEELAAIRPKKRTLQ